MIEANTAQQAFVSGEMSPLILGRNDIEKFGIGGETVENFMPLSQGPLLRRPGTSLLGESTVPFRIILFNYSVEVHYVVRFKAREFIDQQSAFEVVNRDGAVVGLGEHPYADNELFDVSYTQSADILFLAHPNHPPARLSRYAENDWRFDYAPIVNGPFQDVTEESDAGISLSLSAIADSTVLTFVSNDGRSLVESINVFDYVAFSKGGREVLGIVSGVDTASNTVEVKSLEDRCYYFPKNVFSPGTYNGWDSTTGVPKYRKFYMPPDSDFPAFGDTGSITLYIDYTWSVTVTRPGKGQYTSSVTTVETLVIRQLPSEAIRTPTLNDLIGYPYAPGYSIKNQTLLGTNTVMVTSAGGTVDPMFPDAVYPVAFSNTQVITREMVHNYINFFDERGQSYWGAVSGVGNILEQGAYGIIGDIRFLKVVRTPNDVSIIRGDRTISASITASQDIFDPERDAGRPLRLFFEGDVVHAKITTNKDEITPSSCSVSLDTLPTLDTEIDQPILVTADWLFGSWHTGNYPSCVCFFEQRFVFAGSLSSPQSIWMSRSGSFYDFAPTENDASVVDDNAITLTLASTAMNRIKWLQPKQTLVVGTLGSEWIIQAGVSTAAITPTNATARHHSSYGSELGTSLGLSRSTLYVQRGGEKFRDMSYDYYNDIYVSLDLTVFSEHILRQGGGVIAHDYLGNPNPLVVLLLKDGTLAILNYEPDQKIFSWSRWKFQYPVVSMACVDAGGRSGLYLSCRSFGLVADAHGDIYTLEYLDLSEASRVSPIMHFDQRKKLAAGSANGFFWSPQRNSWIINPNAISGNTDKLKDLTIFVNGQWVTDAVYGASSSEGGESPIWLLPSRFNADSDMSNTVVGFNYVSTYKSYPANVQLQSGNIQGKKKRVVSVGFRFKDTIYGKVGRNVPKWPLCTGDCLTNWEDLSKRTDLKFDEAKPASFDYSVPVPNGFDTRGQFLVMQDKPFPMTILALYPEVVLTP